MIVLIVAGGSGTRLWPLSTPDFPKHLLSIVSEDSLLQAAFNRAKNVTTEDKIYISTEAGHVDHVYNQLPALSKNNIIVEPARRDTMPCIMNALQLISTRHPHDEPIASIHADHHIRDVKGFAEALSLAGEISAKHQRITLLGMEPYQPDTKYGYIHKGDNLVGEHFVYGIKQFKEKPQYRLAKEYVESGEYLWNMGYFVAPYQVFESVIKNKADEHWSEQLTKLKSASSQSERDDIYLNFQKEPIDTALMEKATDLLVMPGNFDWMDVGSFDDVYLASDQDEVGNSIIGDNIHIVDSEKIYIRNDADIPTAVIGLDNVVVVNTKHGVLVMKTDQAQKVKQVASKL